MIRGKNILDKLFSKQRKSKLKNGDYLTVINGELYVIKKEDATEEFKNQPIWTWKES